MADSLPTIEEFHKAGKDENQLKDLLLRAFQWGTNFVGITDLSSDHTQQASNLLVEVWKLLPFIEPLLVDVVWMLSCTSPSNNGLSQILKDMVEKVPDREVFWKDLQGTLPDPIFLESTKLLVDAPSVKKKIAKVNTEIYYKQQKYNLLQEESRGYAKLLTILFSDVTKLTPQTLQAHIGAFELDPNRVLDLLLDRLESRITTSEEVIAILKLITEGGFDWEKISSLLIFKMSSYSKDTSKDHEANGDPSSLYNMIVLLAKHKLLRLSALVPTALEELVKCYVHYEIVLKTKISRMGRISLNSDSSKGDPKLTVEQKKLEDATHDLKKKNQLVGLLQVLLSSSEDKSSCWELACELLPDVSHWTKACMLLPETIGSKLCDLIRSQFEPIYKQQVKNSNLSINKGDILAPDSVNQKSFETLLESFSVAIYALGQSGCLRTEPILYCLLCRLTRETLIKQNEKNTKNSCDPVIYALIKSVLMPSLSLMHPNPAISADVWALLSILPYSFRYQIYRDWSGEKKNINASLLQIQAERKAGKSARHSLRRLTKEEENVRDMGRKLSKLTHSNPLVVFRTILNQIESYDNLIKMMVETLRFVTPLSLDVLGYCILSRLYKNDGGANRSRLKDDGINLSQWLQSLEVFTGCFYRKFPDVEFRGLICYIVHQLKEGNVLELGVLKTLITTAGGYDFAAYSPIEALPDRYLESRAGSLVLQRETFSFGMVDTINVSASTRVRSVLQNQGLGVSILILLAQLRHRLVFEGKSSTRKKKPVKLIANLLDSCQVVMCMVLQFLTTDNLTRLAINQQNSGSKNEKRVIETYAISLPSLKELLQKYRLDNVSAWMLCRPIFRSFGFKSGGEKEFKNHSDDRISIIKKMLPLEVWQVLTPTLVDTFFSLSLYDIHFPKLSYDTELKRLNESERLLVKKDYTQPGSMTGQFSREDEEKLGRVRLTLKAIKEDMEKQRIHCLNIDTQMFNSGEFFTSKDIKVTAIQTFITHCIYPRCRLSPDDAAYCVRFVMLMHGKKKAGFSTLHFFDEFIKILVGLLYSSTEDESAALGIVLRELWKIISRWRYDEKAFLDELVGTPGATFFWDKNESSPPLNKNGYIKLYNKWHTIIGRATIGCLNSCEYMHVRSSFAVLGRMVEVFPTQPGVGHNLLDALKPLQKDTYRLQDIKTTAQAYETKLLKARDSGVWKEEDQATINAREKKAKDEIAEKKRRREEQMKKIDDDMNQVSNRSNNPSRENPPGNLKNDTIRPDTDSRDWLTTNTATLGPRWEGRSGSRVNPNGKRGRSRSPRRDRSTSPSRRNNSPQGRRNRSPNRVTTSDEKPPQKRTRAESNINGPNFEANRMPREHHARLSRSNYGNRSRGTR